MTADRRGWVCPACSGAGTLGIVLDLELPPDARSDEITLALLDCSACAFRGASVYEESRRGALDSECWDSYAYGVAPATWEAWRVAIAACPAPGKSGCRCPTHLDLGRADAGGRWVGLAGRGALAAFELRRAAPA